jgi:hypothetical protein
MTKIPEDIIKAGRRCYDGLGRGSVSDSEHIARAILAAEKRGEERERERCAVEIAALREQLAESDRNAEKLEALLDPYVSWEGEPPAALLAAEKRGEERERERCAGIAHKQVFTAKQWGGKDEMLEGGNRRARVIAYLIRKEPAE